MTVMSPEPLRCHRHGTSISDRGRSVPPLTSAWSFFLLLAVLVAVPLSGNVRAGGEKEQALRLRKGPYLQNVRRHSITVMWETNPPAAGEVTWSRDGTTERTQVGSKEKLQTVTLQGLRPGTQYSYTVTARRGPERATGSGTFTTLPGGDSPFSFVVLGDNRSRPKKAQKVMQAITDAARREDPTLAFALHTGDLVANGRKPAHWQNQFFEPTASLIRNLCVWPALGNHERNSELYFRYFSLPGNERWYAFSTGGVHFVFLDLHFSDFTPGSEQYTWLKKELQQNRDRATVVTIHPSPFSSGPHASKTKDGEYAERPIELAHRHLVPLFEKNNVRVVFSGHDHLYERSKKGGVYYICQGMGGAPLYGTPSENPYSQKVITGKLGYSIVRVRDNAMKILTRTAGGDVVDRVTVPLD